ncbi:flavodoxin-dependent (E)-4-hydroxy-3-methylbut-2-enyl-diphosphate synthase [Candidatus Calescamantes bacterium]|nr:flavodoxin-dependent (E)-4-hydroxy-3-methylbut-2-enyl-diphosphate synthase [Candidatus Calescamantes bacterium]
MQRKSRKINWRNLCIGGNSPIRVESMLKSPYEEERSIEELKRLEKEGCELVRMAIPHKKAIKIFKKISPTTSLPIMGDFHFSFSLIKEAVEAGMEGVRINPANFPSNYRAELVSLAKTYNLVVRIGVNSASFRKPLPPGKEGALKMVEEVEKWIRLFEEKGYHRLIISLKSSSLPVTFWANEEYIRRFDYPLHIGITEAGGGWSGIIKSSVGIGVLLKEGIGDTIRVSLTGPSWKEVKVGYEILKALNLRKRGPEFISCPQCGRTRINVSKILTMVKEIVRPYGAKLDGIKIAVMGCEVNGPGEARDADFGLAGGKDFVFFFSKGEVYRKVRKENLRKEIQKELRKIIKEEGRDA